MKNKMLIILSIISIIILILRLLIGLYFKYNVLNIIATVLLVILIILDIIFAIRSKNNLMKILITIIIFLLVIVVLSEFDRKYFNYRTEYNEFKYNKDEYLKNVYYADIYPISTPIELVYEKDLILGIKCSVVIKVNDDIDNIEFFDLEKESKELNNISNKRFCNFKLKKHLIEF